MKLQFTFLRMDKIYKPRKIIIAVLLIFSMAITGIAVSDSSAQAFCYPKPSHSYDVRIDCGCLNFNVRDTSGNILFEIVNGEITQQDMERTEYIYMSVKDRLAQGEMILMGETLSSISDLYIRGCKYFVITCTCENIVTAYPCTSVFTIYTSSRASAAYRAIPNIEISVFDNEIDAESPKTKLCWEEVKTAERYALHALVPVNNMMWAYAKKPFLYTQKTSLKVINSWGDKYQIRAQKKVKGRWRTIKTFEIIVSDDEVNIDSHPVSKLSWNKVKKAERYAVLERRTPNNPMGGIPFDYTKKTSYKVQGEEGKDYQIWAQRKVNGKWKTIKTINLTL